MVESLEELNSAILWTLVVVIVVLLATLLVFARRRRRRHAQFIARLEQLESEGRFDELDAEIEKAAAEDAGTDQESTGAALGAFIKGRPTRRLTAVSVYSFLHGIVAIGLIGFVLFMVFQSAIVDPVVRLILLATFGVAAAILAFAAVIRRSKREKQMLTGTQRDR